MTKRAEFTFGYDLDAVIEVEQYVKSNYSPEEYEMAVGRGDDVMNWLAITLPDGGDEQLLELIEDCDGAGNFEC